MKAKIQELKKALENVEGFRLVNFHSYIANKVLYVKLTKKLKSGWCHIMERHIKLDNIDNEIKEAKNL